MHKFIATAKYNTITTFAWQEITDSDWSTYLPSKVCGPFCSTTVTFAGSANVTKPKPLERPDSAFFMTTQSITSPYLEKYLCRLSWEVSQERPPTKSLLKGDTRAVRMVNQL